jgi:diaminopimelate epimerase
MRFHKYHALGNDYLVMNPADFPGWPAPTAEQIRAICHRNFGVGSDGILWGPLRATEAEFGLRIFNPDGSEAEKSGNGLRIFSRFLYDQKLVGQKPFTIETPGGVVESRVLPGGQLITVAMGRVSFQSDQIPVTGPVRDVLNEKITIQDREFTFCAAGIGNPHCVIILPEISAELAKRYGPDIEVHGSFPNRINVQFLQVLDRRNVKIEIWERERKYRK